MFWLTGFLLDALDTSYVLISSTGPGGQGHSRPEDAAGKEVESSLTGPLLGEFATALLLHCLSLLYRMYL